MVASAIILGTETRTVASVLETWLPCQTTRRVQVALDAAVGSAGGLVGFLAELESLAPLRLGQVAATLRRVQPQVDIRVLTAPSSAAEAIREATQAGVSLLFNDPDLLSVRSGTCQRV